MINHARTLLLNINGSTNSGPNYPGEEYVPAIFKSQNLPTNLSIVRSLLFGPNPDRAMLNYRLRQLLTLTHATELGDYLTALDSRVTYWPLRISNLFKSTTFGAVISLLAGSTTWALSLVGNAASTISTTKLYDIWRIDVLSTSSVKITHQLPNSEVVTSNYSAGSGVSSPIALPGSDLQFTLGVGNTGIGNWPSWMLETTARPLLSLPDIYVALKSSSGQEVDGLFSREVEPYITCRRLWSMPSGPIAYKLGAVVVALSYQLDALYKQQL